MHGGALQVPILMGGRLTGLAPAGEADHRIIGYLHPPASHSQDPHEGEDASMRNLTRQEILAHRLERPEMAGCLHHTPLPQLCSRPHE